MKDNVILVFGDSIVYGLYDKKLNGWVNRLRKKLENDKYFIYNLGIPGNNSLNIKNRFEEEIKSRYNEVDDFTIIYSFGIKDALLLNQETKYINVFKDNIKYIIDNTKEFTNNIYFLSLIEPDYNVRNQYSKENVSKVNSIIRELCDANYVGFIDIFNKINKENLTDGLHPNCIGHELIVNEVLTTIN